MNIHEATKKALEVGGMITRNTKFWENISIEPTNTEQHCIIHGEVDGIKSFRRGWQPSAEDLAADDWEVVEKTIADKAREAAYQLSHGKKTVNQIRQEFGLDPIDENGANGKLIKAD